MRRSRSRRLRRVERRRMRRKMRRRRRSMKRRRMRKRVKRRRMRRRRRRRRKSIFMSCMFFDITNRNGLNANVEMWSGFASSYNKMTGCSVGGSEPYCSMKDGGFFSLTSAFQEMLY
jgi:hypothetical protein